jgi:hypothetical protein
MNSEETFVDVIADETISREANEARARKRSIRIQAGCGNGIAIIHLACALVNVGTKHPITLKSQIASASERSS